MNYGCEAWILGSTIEINSHYLVSFNNNKTNGEYLVP